VRRVALALACAIVLVLPAPAVATTQAAPYEHVWLAEGQVGGDLGGSATKSVQRDSLRLALASGTYTGHLVYQDVLGVQPLSGAPFGQMSSIEVTLTGSSAEGGAAAAGTFAGTATLTTRQLTTLDGLSPGVVRSGGEQVVYDVSGHWGAGLGGGIASGQLLYERATPVSQSTPKADVRDTAWFDRLTAEKDGGAQSFEVPVDGLAAGQTGGGPAPQTASGTSTATFPAGGATSAQSPARPRLGFWGFVARGLAGNPGLPAPALPLGLSEPARALKSATPPGATALPPGAVASDVDVSGALLDAKNRAAGLLSTTGPAGDVGAALTRAWHAAGLLRRRHPIQILGPADIARMLRAQNVPGAKDLAGDLAGAKPGDVDPVLLSAWQHVVEAVAGQADGASVLSANAAVQNAVASTPLPHSGPLADDVRIAARVGGVPVSAVKVLAMKREPSSDATGSADGTLLPNRVLRTAGGSTEGGAATLTYTTTGGRTTVAPPVWLAYERADGTVVWLAGDGGTVALTDGTLHGAGFTVSRGLLVDASDVGRILAVYDLR
jgi:hypothetical protein